MSLSGKICIVTGASRGIGRGIALQLGEAGATVYITGRTLVARPGDPLGGSLTETASEIESRGGKCIPVQCDHSKDEEIAAFFERVKSEQNGRLDVLVNNAYAAVNAITEIREKPFWEQPLSIWDTVNNVGLRNHYICTVYAAKMMVPRKQGLIVNISSAGGLAYIFNVAYGIGKEAAQQKKMFERAETVEYAGKCIVALANDPNVMSKSGKVLMTPELGQEYNLRDIDGRVIDSMRRFNWLVARNPNTAWMQRWLPNFLRMPYWMFALRGSKF
ncbi:dehydrogenase/reductase SDR family member 1-like isoform X2 [Saccostrea cucullata]|uniref:dehydrogenase/reductase SDR family member 1-like isoform X2 n=1 Tax=Saccostrea cuccullata TaxID=36930 RepID=UPI002ED5D708